MVKHSSCVCEDVQHEINIWISKLSKADFSHWCGWDHFNWLKACIEQKCWYSCEYRHQTWTEISASPGSWAYQSTNWNYTIGSYGPPGYQLQLWGLMYLYNCTSQFLVINTDISRETEKERKVERPIGSVSQETPN